MSENAQRDENNATTIIAILDSDGETIKNVCAEPLTNSLCIEDNTTGSDNGPADALHDENSVPTLMAVSSSDGVTPITLYVDSDGKLLVDSN